LHFAETWLYFPRQVRGTLAAYNTLIAVLVGTALSYLPGTREPSPGLLLPRVNVTAPWDWQPTADRPWIVNPLQDMGAAGVVGAMIPGLMIFLLFIIDHNVSSILTQSPKFRLKKPPAYHWDFFVLGLTFVPCALLGLPPGSGLLPQAPLHARSLCTREIQIDASGVKREVVTHVEEQRWTALAQSCLMFVALAAFRVISWIPLGCLYGLFFYLGCGVLHGNEVWDRIAFAFVAAKKRPDIPVIRNVRWSTVVVWTAIQTACAVAIFAVAEFLPVGYIYPVLLALLVPLRSFVLERTFRQDDLTYLDPCENPEGGGGYREEQREIHRAERRASLDGEEDLLFPNRAEFRRQVSQGSHGKKDAAAAAAASIKVLVDEASDHANGVHRC
jgi:boron transporter